MPLKKRSALELAKMGATIIVISRNETKCQNTVDRIKRETGNENVDYFAADLSLMSEIRNLVEVFKAKYSELHVLLNNAGGIFSEQQLTDEGYEMTFALNHLNYFLLTHLLLDTIKVTAATAGEARIVNVSSGAHNFVRDGIRFDDLQRSKDYGNFRVYSETKLMNIMFTKALARRLDGTNITINALHPGFVNTGFGHNNDGLLMKVFQLITPFVSISAEQGAETNIYLASSREVKGVSGEYFDKKEVAKSNAASHDVEAQERLWQISEELTGIAEPAGVV
ncbi:MAG: SDR family oxidoreductase [Aggregatilineales bacterium]